MSALLQRLKRLPAGFWWSLGALALFFTAMGILFHSVLSCDAVMNAPDTSAFFDFRDRFYRLEQLFSGAEYFAPYTLYWFTAPPLVVHTLTFIFDTLLLALAGVYALRGRKVAWSSAWLGGFAVALSGYTFTLFNAGHRGYFHMFALGCFAFGLMLRGFQQRKPFHFAMLGAVLGWGVSAQPDVLLLLLFPLAAYALWLTFAPSARVLPPREGILKVWPWFLLSIATLLLVALGPIRATLTHTVEQRENQIQAASQAAAGDEAADDTETRWLFATNWSLPKADALEFLVPGIFGDESFAEQQFAGKSYWGSLGEIEGSFPNYRQHTVYLGLLTCFLAFFAVFSLRQRPAYAADAPFWAGLALVALILAFGRYTPFYRLFYALPKMDMIRAPVKFLHFTEWAAGMLAALGLSQALAQVKSRKLLLLWGAFLGVLVLTFLVFLVQGDSILAAIRESEVSRAPEVLLGYARSNILRSILLCIAIGVVFYLARFYLLRFAPAVLLLVLVVDQTTVAARYLHAIPVKNSYAANPVVETVLRLEPPQALRLLNYATPLRLPQEPVNTALAARGVRVNPISQEDAARFQQRPDLLWKHQGITFLIFPRRAYDESLRSLPGLKLLMDFTVMPDGRVVRAQPSANAFVLLHLPENRWLLPEGAEALQRRCDPSLEDRFRVVRETEGLFVSDVAYAGDDEAWVDGRKVELLAEEGRAAVRLSPGSYDVVFRRARQSGWLTWVPVVTTCALLVWCIVHGLGLWRKRNG